MRTYWIAHLILILFFVVMLAVVDALQIPILTESTFARNGRGVSTAALGVGLLLSDILLPVPSSLIMIAHGRLFGLLGGTGLSLLGSIGLTMIGFVIGRRGGRLLNRVAAPCEQKRATALIERWGLVAIIITRPLPLLAETVAIMVGTVPAMDWKRVAASASIGALPGCMLYAAAGAYSATLTSGIAIFACTGMVAAIFWIAAQRAENSLAPGPDRQ